MAKTKPFDTSEYLDNEEVISEYLSVAAATGDPDDLLIALSNVAKARGMTQLAKDAGVGRESLYKTLAPGAKPRYSTILKILTALGLSMRFETQNTSDSETDQFLKGSANTSHLRKSIQPSEPLK